MKDTIIWDLDGTLADGRHRLWALPTKDPHLCESWTEFNMLSGGDAPIQDNIDLCNTLFKAGYTVIILTGRSDIAEDITYQWLEDNGVLFSFLKMRHFNDNRQDFTIKDEFLRDEVGLDSILCCFDDLPKVAYHLRSMGLTVHLVTHYDEPRIDLQSHGVTK